MLRSPGLVCYRIRSSRDEIDGLIAVFRFQSHRNWSRSSWLLFLLFVSSPLFCACKTPSAIEECAEKAGADQQGGIEKIEGDSIWMIGQIEGVEHPARVRLGYCDHPE